MFSASSGSASSTLSHASTISRAVSGDVRFSDMTRTFASFHFRAPSAIQGSHASAARTPVRRYRRPRARPAEQHSLIRVARGDEPRDARCHVGPLFALQDLDLVAARAQLLDDRVGYGALVVGPENYPHPDSVAYSMK